MRFLLICLLAAVSFSSASAHDFNNVPDISALDEVKQNQRCVALIVFFTSELKLETVVLDFNYLSGPGPMLKDLIIADLKDVHLFHIVGVSAELHLTEGPTKEGEDIGHRIMEIVTPETELYRKAIATEGTFDADGRVAMQPTVEARHLLSHDLMSCWSQYKITVVDP